VFGQSQPTQDLTQLRRGAEQDHLAATAQQPAVGTAEHPQPGLVGGQSGDVDQPPDAVALRHHGDGIVHQVRGAPPQPAGHRDATSP